MKTFSKAFIYTLFVILLLFSTAGLVSASNLPGLSDKAHIICYPLNTTSRTYAVSAENRYIDPGDECYITAIDGNRIYISYPTSKGRHSEWFNRDAFSVADLANANFPTITAPRKITTYKNAVGSDSFGYLDKGDECYVLTKTHGRTQLIYPVPSGYKMGWVDSGEIYEGTNARIMSIHSALDLTKVIDVTSGAHLDGTNIQLYSENCGKNQGFEMIPVGNCFVIVNTESGKALDVQGGVSASGVNVQLYTVEYNDAQLWETIGSGDSKTYYLKNKLGYFLDVSGGVASDCTNIWVYEGNNSNAQKFKFKPLAENSDGKITTEDTLVEKNIPDGIYTITTALSVLQGVDVRDASTESGANVQIWESVKDSRAQTFAIVRGNDGWYRIWNVNSCKVLDVQDSNNTPGTNIQQWENTNADNQKFKFFAAGNGYYYIKSKIGNFLDVAGGHSENGTNLQLYSFNATDSQKFKLNIQMREGICTITSALNDNAKIDINNANEANGTNIQLWSGNANAANTFLIWRYKDTSHFFIEKLGTNKELDVEGAKTSAETNVQIWDRNYDANQRWEFQDAGDGYYYIKSVLGNLYLDAYGGSSENGTNIQVYPLNGGAGQKWRIDFLDYTEELTRIVNENVSVDSSLENRSKMQNPYRPTFDVDIFISYVQEDGKYDIKTKNSWIAFFPKIPWITADGIIKYNNMLITPEQLGNMVYGHFGRAWGFGCSSLIFGGDVVATATDLTWGDDPSDKAYIERGFYHFGE